MGENVSFFKQKTKVEIATPPADGISKVGSLEGLRSLKLGHLPWVLLPSTLPIVLVHQQRVQAPQILAQLHFFLFQLLVYFPVFRRVNGHIQILEVSVWREKVQLSSFFFFEMFVNFLTCRFHKWDPQHSWERKTSEHLDSITSMSFPIGKEGDVLAKGKSSN